MTQYNEGQDDEYDGASVIVTKVCICRPFRLIGFICLVVALILCIVALCSEWWAHSEKDIYSQGLWTSCRKYPKGSYVADESGQRVYQKKNVEYCEDIDDKPAWLKSVIALMILSSLCTVLAIIAILISLCFNSQTAANVAGCVALASLIIVIVALIVFLAMFSRVFEHIDLRLDLEEEDYYEQERKWYFGWGYGCGWGSAILLSGAACLFLLCKVQDEIYEAEKTYKVDKKGKNDIELNER